MSACLFFFACPITARCATDNTLLPLLHSACDLFLRLQYPLRKARGDAGGKTL